MWGWMRFRAVSKCWQVLVMSCEGCTAQWGEQCMARRPECVTFQPLLQLAVAIPSVGHAPHVQIGHGIGKDFDLVSTSRCAWVLTHTRILQATSMSTSLTTSSPNPPTTTSVCHPPPLHHLPLLLCATTTTSVSHSFCVPLTTTSPPPCPHPSPPAPTALPAASPHHPHKHHHSLPAEQPPA